ncbi:HAD domain-containing protein [Nocardia sp. NPDC049149]|uniref:HAD domain-containing protein n=1 Tax=Nocardia sp. NPDC049149 TaxID=3364315 RepID=UPI00371EF5D1
MDRPDRPLLFLDVDGPLLPFGGTDKQSASLCDEDAANPLVAQLDPALGPLLSNLGCELIWATTWSHDANQYIGPLLGLPTLAVMEWPESTTDPIDTWFGLHWKTRALVERAAGRTFLWIDDEISDSDEEWVSTQHTGRALLYRVDPRVGLRPNDFDVIATWLQA